MTISIDRQSGLFTPELSDRINNMSDLLWQDIQALDVPVKEYKETVTPFKIQTVPACSRQNSFSIGPVRVINLVISGSISSGSFVHFADLPFPPSTDIYMTNGTQNAIYKCKAGTTDLQIYTFGRTISGFDCYFFYVS